ncbi:MAG: hypothetical protein KFH87_06565 [Bacteroidetes bacterium]|nr:hypothetical protein [Bacteroidota bacterium]
MKRSLFFVVVIALLAGVTLLTAEQKDLMEKKTRHAENIFRALALGDLKLVSSEAKALDEITVEAGFDDRPKKYAGYGREFLKSVRSLKKQADLGNLAGSYYEFTRMTGYCFSCHEHIRDDG